LKYRIGIARNDAEELANEMANNYAGSFKQNMNQDQGQKGTAAKKDLPFEAYRKDRRKDIRKDYSEPNLAATKKSTNSNQILGT